MYASWWGHGKCQIRKINWANSWSWDFAGGWCVVSMFEDGLGYWSGYWSLCSFHNMAFLSFKKMSIYWPQIASFTLEETTALYITYDVIWSLHSKLNHISRITPTGKSQWCCFSWWIVSFLVSSTVGPQTVNTEDHSSLGVWPQW